MFVLLSAPGATRGAAAVWANPISANWSLPGAWIDGTAPPAGGAADLALRFENFTTAGYTATNDLGTPTQVNRITLRNESPNALIVANASGSSIDFSGAAPQLVFGGGGKSVLGASSWLNAADGITRITGGGWGGLTTGWIHESTPGQSLVIDAPAPSLDSGLIEIGAAFFSGGVTLENGNVRVDSGFGTGTVTIKGGTLRPRNALGANAFTLDANLIVVAGSMTLNGAISSGVAGTGLLFRNTTELNNANLTLTAASTYSGLTVVDFTSVAGRNVGELKFSGAGSALNSSAFHVRMDGQLTLEASQGANNRVGDTTPVHLDAGELLFASAASTIGTQTETVGSITGRGQSTVTVKANPSAAVQLTAGSLERIERGTFLFRGTNFGATPGVGVGTLFLSTPPTGLVGGGGSGPNISVLPYAIGGGTDTTFGASFVTYDAAKGVRPLDLTTEFGTDLATAAPTNNVRLAASASTAGPVTVNALLTAASGGALNGTGAITITSGALLNHSGIFAINAPLAFGAAEANIFTITPLNVNGPMSGTNGLTKSGISGLNLRGANSFTGPLTINKGEITFLAPENLGSDSSPIILNASDARLTYAGDAPLTLGRGLEMRGGVGELSAFGQGRLTIGGTISGAGGIALGGRLALGPSNTYGGPTRVTGDVLIQGDGSLGSGGAVALNAGTLRLGADWATSRAISINSSSATVDTGGFTGTLAGVLSGAAQLTKSGVGALRVPVASPFAGPVVVKGGTFALTESGSVWSTAIRAEPSGTVLLDNSLAGNADRLLDNAELTMAGGGFALAGNAAIPITETLGKITINATGGSALTLTAPGGARTILRAGELALTAGDLLVRSDQLGDAARLVVNTAPALVAGIVPGVYTSGSSSGSATTFGVYDSSISNGEVVGLRSLRTEEIEHTSVIRNPANGGTTSTSAHVESDAATSAIGATNTIASLTLDGPATLTLAADQRLVLGPGGVLIRASATAPSLSGGTLEFSAGSGALYLGTDTTVTSSLAGSAGVRKTGPGTLTFDGLASFAGPFSIGQGRVRSNSGQTFTGSTVNLEATGTFDLEGRPTSLGALTGAGVVALGSGTLEAGTLPASTLFAGSITGSGGLLIVDGGLPGAFRGFTGASSFSGGTTLNGGRLFSGSAEALGTGPLTVNGGSFVANTAAIFGVPIVLTTDLRTEGAGTVTLRSGAPISGNHAVEVRGPGGLIIQSAAAHTGETRTLTGTAVPPSSATGTLTLSGAAGALTASPAIRIGRSSGLVIDDTTAFSGGASGRIGDAVPLFVESGSVQLRGNASVPSTETVGALHGAGHSTLTITPGSGVTTRLSAASLDRMDRATFLFRSPLLGAAAGAGVGQVLFSNPPAGLVGGGGAGPATSILPYAIGDTSTNSGTGKGLVTYDVANGVRLLNTATEYAPSLTAAAATDNVRLTATATSSAARAINALVLEDAVSISGSGSLAIGSGTILKVGATAAQSTIANALDFGAAEAVIFATGSDGSLNLAGAIHGSGGLTKSGPRPLTLSGANDFTGPITINAGDLLFSSAQNLASDPGPIIFNGGVSGAQLSYSGSTPFTLTRDLELKGGYGFVRPTTAGVELTLQNRITGPGGLGIGKATTGIGFVKLASSNDYTGPTLVQGGLAIASDAAFGAMSLVEFNSGGIGAPRLRLDGPWTTNRLLYFAGSAVLDTNGFDATWSGQLRSFGGSVTKLGIGTLTVSADTGFFGTLRASAGLLTLSGAGATEGGFGVDGGTTVRFDNGSVPSNDRIGDTGILTLGEGRMELLGNASSAVREVVGALQWSDRAAGVLALTAPGSFSTILDAASLTAGANALAVFQGSQLGGGPAGAFTRVTLRNPGLPTGGIFPNAIVDTGGTEAFATYDATVDAAGPVGVCGLRANEYFTTSSVQNPTTPATANLLVNGAVEVVGAQATLNSATFTTGGSLTLETNEQLTISGGTILTPRGVTDASLIGGTLLLGGDNARFAGDGDLTVSSRILTGNLFSPSIVKLGAGTLTLLGDVPRAGFSVVAGQLRLGEGAPLGSSGVALASGTTLEIDGVSTRVASVSGSGHIALNAGHLTIGGSGFASGIFTGTTTGPGALTLSGNFAPTQPLAHTGPTFIGVDSNELLNSGTFTLAGDATLLDTARVKLTGTMRLENALVAANRLGPGPFEINSGFLTLHGNRNVSHTQSIGNLVAAGESTIVVESDTAAGTNGVTTTLAIESISRPERGTFDFRLTPSAAPTSRPAVLKLGATALGDLVGAGTTATNQPVLPYAVDRGTTDAAFLVTHTPGGGVRPLNPASELSPNLTAGDNVRLSNGGTLSGNLSINALHLTGFLGGSGTLNVASGAILVSGGGTINVPLDFGTKEAVIYSFNSSQLFQTSQQVNIGGTIAGTGGLTFSGLPGGPQKQLGLYGQNTFSGPLVVNDGTVYFREATNLGQDPSPIALNSGTLAYQGFTDFTLQRGIESTGGVSRINSVTNRIFTLGQPLIGAGGFDFRGKITLTGPNTYTGRTEVSGELFFPSDAALGNGSLLVLYGVQIGNGTILHPQNAWTTNRAIYLSGIHEVALDSPSDVVWNGPITSDLSYFDPFRKRGGGTLTLTAQNAFGSPIYVEAGALMVEGTVGTGGFGSGGGISVSAGAVLGGSGVAERAAFITGTLAPGSDGPGALSVRSVSFAPQSTFALELDSAQSFDQLRVTGTVTLDGTVDLSLAISLGPEDRGNVFAIIENDGVDAVVRTNGGGFAYAGNFLDEGEVFITAGGQELALSYAGGSGNDVVLIAIPEPGSATLLLAAIAWCNVRQRRHTPRCAHACTTRSSGCGVSSP